MTGLEKMLAQIAEEAAANAAKLTAAAEAEAAGIREKANADAEKLKEDLAAKAAADAAAYEERTQSSAELQRRTAMLRARQEVIADVLAKAYEKLDTMDDDAYFAVIRRMLRKYVQPEAGTICFSAKDRKRLPGGFEKEAADIAAEKGGTLKLGEVRNIENGFVLSYGGIEENCTFKALFNAEKDRLQDIINKEVFL
ncbi:MAG: V-type ATP synthase subunit E [Eubacteriales bacterium]|nr:V-type ATP synthase subunit E [Eubacteriales bacterium]